MGLAGHQDQSILVDTIVCEQAVEERIYQAFCLPPRWLMATATGLLGETSAPTSIFVYEQVSDEELVQRTQQFGDRRACEYLLYKYRNLVKAKVQSYFLMGAERDDGNNRFPRRSRHLLCGICQSLHPTADDLGNKGRYSSEADSA